MASQRKPPVKKVKFELTHSGIAGIGIVCFCIFLWMFLLGVWTGQSLLLPSASSHVDVAQNIEAGDAQSAERLHLEAEARKKVKTNP